MATPKFDSLYDRLLTEAPVYSDEPSFSSSLEQGVGAAAGNAYLIGDIASSLGKTKEEVVKEISASLYNKIFGDEGNHPANNEKEYREAIATALKEVINDLKSKYPEMKVPGNEARTGFTSRIVSSLAKATKDFSETVSKGELKVATGNAAAEEDSEEHAENSDTDETTNSTSETDVVAGVVQPVSYKAYNDYFIKNRDDIPSGTLTSELEPIYTRLEGLTGTEVSGETIETTLRKAGTEQGKIVRYIKDLIKANVIEPSESAKTSDEIAALEPGEENMEDIEKDTFDKLYKHAFRDYKGAGGAPAGGYGGDYED